MSAAGDSTPSRRLQQGVAAGLESEDTDPRWQEVTPSSAEWEDALHMVQSLDPPGVGAENLIDCLCLQLHRMLRITSWRIAGSLALDDLTKPSSTNRQDYR